MFTSDPPQHTRLRRAVAPFLARRRISSLQAFIEHTADTLIDGIGGGTTDAVDDFAAPLTVLTICRLLGVPPHENHRILGWSHALMTEQTSPSARQRSLGAGQALTGFLAGFLAEQKAHPADGLIGSLVTAPPGARLSDEEILTMAMLMLVAGHETSIGLIAAAIRHLLCDPAAAQTLRQHPEALPGAITEILRYDGPVTMTVRLASTAAPEQLWVSLKPESRLA
jgi:cytochrome P450